MSFYMGSKVLLDFNFIHILTFANPNEWRVGQFSYMVFLKVTSETHQNLLESRTRNFAHRSLRTQQTKSIM